MHSAKKPEAVRHFSSGAPATQSYWLGESALAAAPAAAAREPGTVTTPCPFLLHVQFPLHSFLPGLSAEDADAGSGQQELPRLCGGASSRLRSVMHLYIR